MSKQTVDILPESKKSDNIFDQYYALIERYKLTKENSRKYDILVKSLEIVERNLIDLHELRPIHRSESKRLDTFAQAVLESWFEIFIFFREDETFVDALGYSLLGLGMSVQDLSQATKRNLDSLSGFFMPGIDYASYDFADVNKSLTPSFETYSEYIKVLPRHSVSSHLDKYAVLSEQTLKMNYKIVHRLQTAFLGIAIDQLASLKVEEIRDIMRRMDLIQIIFDYQVKLMEVTNVS